MLACIGNTIKYSELTVWQTKMNKIMKKSKLAILAIGIIMIAGCGDSRSPEEIVSQRALERWEMRKTGETKGLYDYLSPAQRQTLSREKYEGKFGTAITYKDVKVKDIACEVDNKLCTIRLDVSYVSKTPYGTTDSGATVRESWVNQDDQWWFFDKE